MAAVLNPAPTFTALDYYNHAALILDLMKQDKDNWDKFVLLSEEASIDPQAVVAAGKLDIDPHNPNQIDSLDVVAGKWSLSFSMDESTWRYRNAPAGQYFVSISVKLDGKWVRGPSFYVDYARGEITDMSVKEIYYDIFLQAKNRIALTVREYDRYLADKAKYDTLRKVFKINPRKK